MHLRFRLPVFLLVCLVPSAVHADRAIESLPAVPWDDDQARARLAPGDTLTVLGTFDFDGPNGPSAQGWTTDDTNDPGFVHWHVDDFSGLSTPLAALEGSRSLWFGRRADSPKGALWESNGYGPGVDEWFVSREFSSANGFELTFDAWWKLEFSGGTAYDRAVVETSVDGGAWTEAGELVDTGSGPQSYVFGAGARRFRIRVITDGLGDAADGLVPESGMIIDALRVLDGVGTALDEEFFEDEALGANETADGDWTWDRIPPFGDFAGLFDGTTVVQDDPLGPNTTGIWGFFLDSPDSFVCGGRPDQPVVPLPLGVPPRVATDVIDNSILSPWLPLDRDADGTALPEGIVQSVVVDYDAYLEGDLDQVLHTVGIRTRTAGIVSPWSDPFAYTTSSPVREWNRYSVTRFSSFLDGADEVQIRLRAYDLVALVGSVVIPCHGISPMFDNVTISVEVDTTAVLLVTTTADAGPGSLREAITTANGTPGTELVLFDLPGAAPHRISLASPLPIVTESLVIDAATLATGGAPGVIVDGNALVAPDADGFQLAAAATLNGLSIVGMPDRGVEVAGDGATVRACWIGLEPDSTPGANGTGIYVGSGVSGTTIVDCRIAANTASGVVIEGSGSKLYDNAIGVGPQGQALGNGAFGVAIDDATVGAENIIGEPGRGNEIAYNGRDGVILQNLGVVRGNSIHDNADLGIHVIQTASPAPSVGSASTDGTSTQVEASVVLSGSANASLTIDVYANLTCDGSGSGEGRVWLGSFEEEAVNGLASFERTLPTALPGGTVVTLTSTREGSLTSEFSVCETVTNTPNGSAVTVPLPLEGAAPIVASAVTFDSVSVAGVTSVTAAAPPATPIPSGFLLADPPIHLDVSTTASFVGDVEVCVEYDEAGLGLDEVDLRLLHFVGGVWVDVTTSVDTGANRLCGLATSLSPFAVVAEEGATSVPSTATPRVWALRGPQPNPFNPRTTIVLEAPRAAGRVEVTIFDVAGRRVRTLHDGALGAGRHEMVFDGRDDAGREVASGAYFVRMLSPEATRTQKLVLVR